MVHARWLMVGLLCCAGMAEAQAQVFFNPYGRGGRFKHRRHHRLPILGYGSLEPYGPYAVYGGSASGVTIVVQPTPSVIVGALRGIPIARDDGDMAPIDLDVTDPVTMKPRKPLPEEMERPEPIRRQPERPMPRPPMPEREPPPREEPEDGITDPVELGKRAFADRDYGLAAQRFRQAALADPEAFLPQFLLAQAQFALGKYRDAAAAIRAGLDLKRDWPANRFRPRELYKGNEIEFLGHVKRLEDLLEKHPNDSVLLFVLAYELWFDGQRDKARALFKKVRAFLPDPRYVDRFLKGPG